MTMLAALLDGLSTDFIRESIRPAVAERAPQLAHAVLLARAQGTPQAEIDRRIEAELLAIRDRFASVVGATMADTLLDELRIEYHDSLAELAARTAGGGSA